VARNFGWTAVAGPEQMDWATYAAARQYLTEEYIGAALREAKRMEDHEAKAARKAIQESRR
jgi:hypothetical protein